jgi:hypothetical protein
VSCITAIFRKPETILTGSKNAKIGLIILKKWKVLDADSVESFARCLTYWAGQFSSGIVDGFNTKAKLTLRKPFGFRTFRAFETALYHTLGGALPELAFAHKFG